MKNLDHKSFSHVNHLNGFDTCHQSLVQRSQLFLKKKIFKCVSTNIRCITYLRTLGKLDECLHLNKKNDNNNNKKKKKENRRDFFKIRPLPKDERERLKAVSPLKKGPTNRRTHTHSLDFLGTP